MEQSRFVRNNPGGNLPQGKILTREKFQSRWDWEMRRTHPAIV